MKASEDGLSRDREERESPALSSEKKRGRFLAGPGIWRKVLAACFLAGVLAACAFHAGYHWIRPSPLICYVIVWPPMIGFALVLPMVLAGIPAVRTRWLLCGLMIWALAFGASEELFACVRPFEGRARRSFENARNAASAFVETNPAWRELDYPLRVVTWNVGLGRFGEPERVVRQLEELDPDVVLLQEYSGGSFDRLFAESPLFSAYGKCRVSRNVILSRYGTAERVPFTNELKRNVVAWKIEPVPGAEITLLSVHMPRFLLQRRPLFRSWSYAKTRENILRTRENLNTLRGLMGEMDGPVIVAGDFNLPAYYRDIADSLAPHRDGFGEAGFGWGKTVPANYRRIPRPVMRIDQVYVPREARVFYAATVAADGSDHRPVLVEVAVSVVRKGEDVVKPDGRPPSAGE